MKYLLFIPLGLFCIQAQAQILKGVVYNNNSKQVLYPVTVINLTTQQVTYTTENGSYAISAKAGEKVAFSFIGYKAKQYIMPISIGEYSKNISLEPISYQLKEITLLPDYTQYQLDSIENTILYRNALTRQRSSPLSSPFSFVAEKFNKRSKQLFKFQKNLVKWENERFIDTRYTPQLVNDQTGLTGDSIGHFMNAYPMPYDFARAATDLEMKMWIRFHYKEWLKHVDTAGLPKIDDGLIKELD